MRLICVMSLGFVFLAACQQGTRDQRWTGTMDTLASGQILVTNHDSGSTWVEQAAGSSGDFETSVFDVFASAGRYLGPVDVPYRLRDAMSPSFIPDTSTA